MVVCRTAKVAIAALLLACGTLPAWAIDTAQLPAQCQATLAQMQGDKARFAALGKAMTQARKSSDTNAFCMSARQIVVLIKGQSSQLDECVGELGNPSIPQAAANQMLALKSVYRQMLDAARNEKNDRFHCGLADQ